jgi:uncharacterized membrane protein
MEFVGTFAQFSADLLEIAGIAIILVYAAYGVFSTLFNMVKKMDRHTLFRSFRLRIAGGILLGLEFMVAADIIMTVAIERTFTSVGVLALIVLVRTFLNFTLELDMAGRWPWESPEK